ncbi:addiction module antitoxin [Enterococcus faecium]|uniref:Addiction module antitoxin n=1 Tax=Enterococcus faecium TaxID=1352 RepID=A0AB73NQJ9_ENTFC|nr:addiction module antitoxin [Enterococcus faecium]EGP4986501.1 addiction module antitoxin [Enterococcus faecium]EGP5088697.1 addiction module antitoxin [Enterococcus faecium]EGP5140882.1 addiction module antitoxin [Enterococcus faecium]EME3547446.1 addiction module antitoxin [Enterococcus faecium]EME7167544.1 addiction module antitoxin [Enterococcus faecium]
MSIKERKFREVGNSVVLTISKEFLKENGLNPGDTVFLDEEKLRSAITKKQTISDEIDIAISQALTDYDSTFRELVEK